VIYHNAWVTDFAVTAENVATMVGIGRARWKIENEQFNVQKNHGSELEHHYGHGARLVLGFVLAEPAGLSRPRSVGTRRPLIPRLSGERIPPQSVERLADVFSQTGVPELAGAGGISSAR
jgi:hypothetical protein